MGPDRQAAGLEHGAVDLGMAGPDDDFGSGRLDASAAYGWLATAPDFSLAAAPALQVLRLDHNRLKGTVPAGLASRLTVFDVSDNPGLKPGEQVAR